MVSEKEMPDDYGNCCWVLAGDDGEKLMKISLISSIFQRQQFLHRLYSTLIKFYLKKSFKYTQIIEFKILLLDRLVGEDLGVL
jgi:hypothetical protein